MVLKPNLLVDFSCQCADSRQAAVSSSSLRMGLLGIQQKHKYEISLLQTMPWVQPSSAVLKVQYIFTLRQCFEKLWRYRNAEAFLSPREHVCSNTEGGAII